MSKYTFTTLFFGVILLIIILAAQYEGLNPWWILLPVSLYAGFLVLGSISIGLNFYIGSHNRGDRKIRAIALTFDDGPEGDATGALMDLLKRYNAPATFFCIGRNVVKNKPLVSRMHAEGHLVGNHSFTHHRWFDLFAPGKMAAEIMATNREIERITGQAPLLFRPPYGVTNPSLAKALAMTGMTSVGWSLRSFDTIKDGERVLRKLKRKTRPGDVVLFHDRAVNLHILEEYLKWLADKNMKVVSLTELLGIEAYAPD